MLHSIAEVEQLVTGWQGALGESHLAYKNHIYRVINFCTLQRQLDETELRQVVIASCFHDIAIWLDDTFDYLAPSREYTQRYLERNGIAEWGDRICQMIEMHHKLAPYQGDALVETFRRADWIDVTLGALRFGVTGSEISAVRKAFPNAGFHPFLLRRSGREFITRPWKPLPMMRW